MCTWIRLFVDKIHSRVLGDCGVYASVTMLCAGSSILRAGNGLTLVEVSRPLPATVPQSTSWISFYTGQRRTSARFICVHIHFHYCYYFYHRLLLLLLLLRNYTPLVLIFFFYYYWKAEWRRLTRFIPIWIVLYYWRWPTLLGTLILSSNASRWS